MPKRRRATARPSPNPSPPPAPRPATANLLLDALPAAEYARLLPSIEIMSAGVKEILHRPGEPIDYVYFPAGGFVSELSVLEDGTMVEVNTVGREGVVGAAAVLGPGPVSHIAMVQAHIDTCYRMSVTAFREELDRRGRLHELATRYAQAIVGVIMQSAACNAIHTVEQRLARWLLMAHDRVGKDAFPLTQEFVAMMLGSSRPTVTLVAGTLQRAGLITYRRGLLTIVDRQALEGSSCECYRAATALIKGAIAQHRPVSASS